MRKFRKRSQKGKQTLICLLILIALFTAIIKLDARMRPIIKIMAKNNAETMSMHAIDDAITEEIGNQNLDYNTFVTLEYGSDGSVISLQTNTVALNSIRAKITNRAIEKITAYDSDEFSIPIGTLLGSEIFLDRGPKLKVRLTISGRVLSDIESVFESTGINQTHHKINLHYKFSVYAAIPGYKTATEIDKTVTIAETIIVGKAPDNFTNIDGIASEKELGYSYDFGTSKK